MSFVAEVSGSAHLLRAETGYDAWLRYVPIDDACVRQIYAELPATAVTVGSSPVIKSAGAELSRGVLGMLGRHLRRQRRRPEMMAAYFSEPSIRSSRSSPIPRCQHIPPDGFRLKRPPPMGSRYCLLRHRTIAAFCLEPSLYCGKSQLHHEIAHLNESETPSAPIRWTNEWNNLDGSIERGYAGRSIFFDGGNVRPI